LPPRPFRPWPGAPGSAAPRRGLLGGLAIGGIVALLLVTLTGKNSDPVPPVASRDVSRSCVLWHQLAGAAVTELVHSGHDADLLHANDAIFRMRRARRNCQAGWVMLACQDYHAVAAGTVGRAAVPEHLFPCARVIGSSSLRP
jgi:hypothetical protein